MELVLTLCYVHRLFGPQCNVEFASLKHIPRHEYTHMGTSLPATMPIFLRASRVEMVTSCCDYGVLCRYLSSESDDDSDDDTASVACHAARSANAVNVHARVGASICSTATTSSAGSVVGAVVVITIANHPRRSQRRSRRSRRSRSRRRRRQARRSEARQTTRAFSCGSSTNNQKQAGSGAPSTSGG